ncbi:MAG: hypothetical protein LBL92_02445 [Propionibacteriaceae bacterium]|nr:hypothetical protein [Propionibacteriaceae bacterium]
MSRPASEWSKKTTKSAKDKDKAGKRPKAEKFRREFSANVSHELKTPLTSILGYAELLDAGLVQEADKAEFIRRIRREAERMIELVEHIMLLSHLDEGNSEEMFEPVDLTGLVTEVLHGATVKAERYQVSLHHDGPDIELLASPTLLSELVHNLVDNAIKYNRPGGLVTVTTSHQDQLVTLVVADNGIGIPAGSVARVFERFYRGDESRSKATGGTGLGLAIVKHIALAHRADISLDSQEGRGTTITVRFPAAPALA